MANNNTNLFRALKNTIAYRFNLHIDKADEADVLIAIKKNIDFVGPNLWTLIFAIFIASIGLNVNSTSAIIGAMLISPLMGPIMGIGMGIGINDFELVKKGSRNLLVATLISITTSTFYFWITPLHDAQSELLARTTPSIWDVFIAFVGGLAGVVAATRKEKTNVIPGVAIATALMPPLCTAGYGIASGNIYFFLGALYLYFINSVFICISTYLIIRFLKFPKKEFEDESREKKVSRYILIIVLLTILPSVWLAYKIVDKSIFENNANKFVNEEFKFRNTQVVNKTFKYDTKGNEIDLLLIGYEISQKTIDTIRHKMAAYRLDDTKLIVRQGLNAKQEIDFSQIKASILEDVFKKDSLNVIDNQQLSSSKPFSDIKGELASLYPNIKTYSIANVPFYRTDTDRIDTITLAVLHFSKTLPGAEQNRLQKWLKARLKADSVKLVVE